VAKNTRMPVSRSGPKGIVETGNSVFWTVRRNSWIMIMPTARKPNEPFDERLAAEWLNLKYLNFQKMITRG